MKRLVLNAQKIKMGGGDQYAVTIVEQTHFRDNFGNNYKFFKSKTNTLELCSDLHPENAIGSVNKFFVRGLHVKRDNDVVLVQENDFEKLKVVVREYNEYFNDVNNVKDTDDIIVIS